jgi:protein O-mannosyl-transferase
MASVSGRLGVTEQWQATALFLAALFATWLAYSPGLGGALHFDDAPNLGGLAKIADKDDALGFIASGISGPLGRPIALATFVPEAHAWPNSPEVFLRTNILIHLINGALVTWLLYLLGLARGVGVRQAALVGAASGAIWMLMPILASSTLLVVQRMTTLSATFVLFGMVAYLKARGMSMRRPTLALFGMTLAIGLGTALGAFTKENGVLLCLFVFAFEATLLKRPPGVNPIIWRAWFTAVLAVPMALLFAYLMMRFSYAQSIVLSRDFNGIERLLTQSGILWKYLYIAFLPNAASLGPFHDDYAIQRSFMDVPTLLAVAGWIAAISVAVIYRRKAPLFTFAVTWYLLGHSLESTSIPLELYFEHRNYLPLVGPVYALVCASLSLTPRWQRAFGAATTIYSVILIGMLFSITTLWGTPRLAAEIWHLYSPTSSRAVQNLAGQMELENDFWGSRRLLERFVAENQDAHNIKFQALNLACVLEPAANHSNTITDLASQLSTSPYRTGFDQSMRTLHELVRTNTCPSIDDEAIYQVGRSLLHNPRYNVPFAKHQIHLVMAQIGLHRGDLDLTMKHLEDALELYPNLVTLDVMISVLDSAGLHELSRERLEDARGWEPRQPLQAWNWRGQLDRIEAAHHDNLRLTEKL